MLSSKIQTCFAFLIFFSFNLHAQDIATSINLGTTGVGLKVHYAISDQFNLQTGFSYLSTQYKMEESGGDAYKADADIDLSTINFLADYYPFETSLRVSAGVFINLNAIDSKMTPVETYTVGEDVYTPDILGNLDAELKFSKFAPYIGLGIGNPASGEPGLKFLFDIGAFYHDAPQVELGAQGMLSPSAAPDQEQKLEDNISWFKWYPVLSVGLAYKF